MDLQEAITLRNKTIVKQQKISNLPVPSLRYSKQELGMGMQGRVKRRQERIFTERIKKQKMFYDKQRRDLDKYMISLQTQHPIVELGVSAVTSPIPVVSFLRAPVKGKVRNLRKRGRR